MNPIDAFLQPYPPSTAGTYARTLAEFIARTQVDVITAGGDDVARYYAAIAEQAPSTVNRKLATLSAFYTYLRRRGIRQDDPMLVIGRRPKVDRDGGARWMNAEDQRTMLDATDHARNLALVWVLLHGLRIAEAMGLNVEDYRYGELTFRGKGNKERTVPVLAAGQIALDASIGRRRSGPLFRGPHGRLSIRQAQRIVNTISLRSLGVRYNPHALRHGFGTRHAKAGTPLPQLQRLMGHADASTTQRYVHLNTDDLRQAMMNDPLAEPQELQVIEGGKEQVAG